MLRTELFVKVVALKQETQAALQLVFDTLNKGQQQKLLKEEAIVALFDRYEVNYDGSN